MIVAGPLATSHRAICNVMFTPASKTEPSQVWLKHNHTTSCNAMLFMSLWRLVAGGLESQVYLGVL